MKVRWMAPSFFLFFFFSPLHSSCLKAHNFIQMKLIMEKMNDCVEIQNIPAGMPPTRELTNFFGVRDFILFSLVS